MSGRRPVPAGLPLALSNLALSPLVEQPVGALPATTTGFIQVSSSSRRTGRRGLAAVWESLSARDWQVLEAVGNHRYLSTRQIEGFCFNNHATALTAARVCRRVLRRLAHLRLLQHLERRIGGMRAGSASYVWQLGPVGDRLLRERQTENGAVRTRQHQPSTLFLDHCLAIADAHLELVRADREGQLELITVQTEPACWRRYSGLGSARLVLQPDLYVVTGDPRDHEFVNCWLVEIDLGTEHPKRLLAKSARYMDYRRSGGEQPDGEGFPLVLWVMRDASQAERLKAAIARDGTLDERLYRITTPSGFLDVIRGGVQ